MQSEFKAIVATKIIVILIALGISSLIGAFCWPYIINTWLEFMDKN